MGLFDSLKGAFDDLMANAGAHELPGLLTQALGSIGGLQGIVDKLNASGLGPQVSSWLGGGANAPITTEEIRGALGGQHLQEIAASLGIPVDKVVGYLSAHLPAAVDQASPNGVIQPTN